MTDDGPRSVDTAAFDPPGEDRRVLDLLDDDRCLALLRALMAADEPLTVPALVERSGVPESTTYRKLRRLGEAELVRDRRRLDGDGRCSRTYEAEATRVTVDVDGDGVDVHVSGGSTDRRSSAPGDD